MRPTFRVLFFTLIILIFGTVPPVHGVEPDSTDFANATVVTCTDPPTSWNGEIKDPDRVDYYAIDLVAGQVLTIDVDAEIINSPLDSLLEVFDGDGNQVGVSDDDRTPGENSFSDPLLETTASGFARR